MTSQWKKLVHALAYARLELVFPAIANNWLIILLTRDVESPDAVNPDLLKLPLTTSFFLTGVIAVGLSIYSLALNDVLDARHDRAFSPDRPIPAGRVGQQVVVAVAFICLLAALCAVIPLGREASLLCLFAALAALFYNTVGKHMPAVGITTLGLIWAVGMLIPNPHMAYAWPVWMTMSHVMACAVANHIIEGKRPRFRAAEWLGVLGGWTFWTLVLVLWMRTRSSDGFDVISAPPAGLWVGPLVAIGVFIVAAWWTLRGNMGHLRTRRIAGGNFRAIAMLWLIGYDAAWLLSADAYRHGFLMLGIFAAAFATMRVGSLIVRLTGPPPTYRVRTTME